MRINETIRQELLTLAKEDARLREELAADGSLFEGYHPRMEEVHKRNAARLMEIITEHGFPYISLVGEDGEDAAWLIVQHDIGEPDVQRKCLILIKEAVAKGEAPSWQLAYLDDRIRTFEGRPQLYGTQFDWDENGLMSPLPIEDEKNVDKRRTSVGLPPLAETIEEHRARISKSNEHCPPDLQNRKKEMDDWARSIGWRD